MKAQTYQTMALNAHNQICPEYVLSTLTACSPDEPKIDSQIAQGRKYADSLFVPVFFG